MIIRSSADDERRTHNHRPRDGAISIVRETYVVLPRTKVASGVLSALCGGSTHPSVAHAHEALGHQL
eukprot:scaffold508971_cov20-Prasinocladus_malaysianus.AAC.2